MQSNTLFPADTIFTDTSQEQCLPKEGRHAEHVDKAQQKYFHSPDVYVDCQGSMRSITAALGVVPCITPTHAVYSLRLQRYLGPKDFLNLQGLFPSAFTSSSYESLMKDPKLCQDLAGNSFSGTVNQAVLFSSLICTNLWDNFGATPPAAAAEDPVLVRYRIRGKRKCPDQVAVQPPDRENIAREGRAKNHKKRYQRKNKGVDGRKTSSGKKEVATIWQKELVFCPQFASKAPIFFSRNCRVCYDTSR